ncbi:GSCOCG00003648001-RA-CDS [Cotesia congregata]|uniref:Phenylalanine--tRNA ligase beta subunit n=1 Tax=Cotesia congregata TaxID=51543 RepID=A0A8J2MYE0_COTCN|nr:GSCOCG00003648001-RA-CDS [Cotesia congregata]CAG5107537.1 Similar to beta-PheRS: Phenylalanine--tRNA ligase beta subunit (Drosophila melanogaster) [Cotesia congregata]
MPTVSVKRDSLFKALGQSYSDDEFQKLCFDFGLELDEVTTEQQIIAKEQGTESSKGASEEIIYKIDVPANRYDLLCLEGLTAGLLVFLEKIPQPRYKLIYPTSQNKLEKITVKSACMNVRPFVVGAILRGITLTKESYDSFIDLQDKLHQNLGRKRSLVSIGTHDLDTIKGPFVYNAEPPKDINFKPLNQDKEYNGEEIMDLYAHHAQLKQYLPIIKDSPVYPIIYDSNGVVLSLPPIINSDHSKITLNTKNIFIECTNTDLTKGQIAVDILVSAFSQYCKDKYTVEPVEIIYEATKEVVRSPTLQYRSNEINSDDAVNFIGIKETPQKVAKLLSKMCLKSQVKNGNILSVEIPPTRHDVIHARDIYEDIAIAWGYNNILKTVPKILSVGKKFPLNKLTDHLRQELAQCAFTETLTFALCSREDVSDKLGWSFDQIPAVTISNPKTLEFQVVRTTLLPGLLKTIGANKNMPLPLKLYEISDVVLRDPQAECGARNQRRLCALYYNKSAGLEVIHGLLDRIMSLLEVPWNVNKTDDGYYLEATEDPTYFSEYCANVIVHGKVIGKMGVLHPDVLHKFDLRRPCSVVEINIEPFL